MCSNEFKLKAWENPLSVNSLNFQNFKFVYKSQFSIFLWKSGVRNKFYVFSKFFFFCLTYPILKALSSSTHLMETISSGCSAPIGPHPIFISSMFSRHFLKATIWSGRTWTHSIQYILYANKIKGKNIDFCFSSNSLSYRKQNEWSISHFFVWGGEGWCLILTFHYFYLVWCT